MTKTFDASPLTRFPSGLPTLPTGTFALPLSVPSAVQDSCLVNPEQSKGWSCTMPQSPLQMQILDLAGVTNKIANKEIILDYGKATMRGFPYGTQPPVLDDPLVLNLVVDQQDPQRGPAWFFQTIYNKIVVVPEDLLNSPYDQKRDLNSRDDSYHHDTFPSTDDFIRRGSAPAGSTPWFCYWNGTLLEAFLYVNQTSSEAAHASQHLTTSSATATATGTAFGTASSFPSATATSPIVINEEYTWGKEHEQLPAYPKVLKFQERRLPQGAQAIPPYCTKRFIAADGTAQDIMNSTGSVITLYLDENVPAELQPMKRAYLYGNSPSAVTVPKEVRRGESGAVDADASCGCVWVAS